jgi:hypothetical protein
VSENKAMKMKRESDDKPIINVRCNLVMKPPRSRRDLIYSVVESCLVVVKAQLAVAKALQIKAKLQID